MKSIKHICNKEADIAMMNQKLTDLDKKVDEIKVDLKAYMLTSENNLKTYMATADTRYASKTEVDSIKEQIKENKKEQEKVNEWTKEKVFVYAEKIAIAGLLGVIAYKQYSP